MTTEIALPSDAQAERPSLARYLENIKPEIARALPRGMDPDRIARLALTVVRQSDMAASRLVGGNSYAEGARDAYDVTEQRIRAALTEARDESGSVS